MHTKDPVNIIYRRKWSPLNEKYYIGYIMYFNNVIFDFLRFLYCNFFIFNINHFTHLIYAILPFINTQYCDSLIRDITNRNNTIKPFINEILPFIKTDTFHLKFIIFASPGTWFSLNTRFLETLTSIYPN